MSTGPRPGSADRGGGMDIERDAWLREALRHAPDADAGAPARVSDAILRQARQATAASVASSSSRREPPRPSPWATMWAWLMQPSVATGFAGVMVATLVGVMWWGRPIDEPLRDASRPDVAAPTERNAVPAERSEAPTTASTPPPAAEGVAPPAAPRQDNAARVTSRELSKSTRQPAPPATTTVPMSAKKAAPPEPRPFPAEGRAAQATEESPRAAMAEASARARSTVPVPPPAAAVAVAPRVTERKPEQGALADAPATAARGGTQVAEAEAPTGRPLASDSAQAAADSVAPDALRRREAQAAAVAGAGAAPVAPGTLALPSLAARTALQASDEGQPVERLIARLRAALAAAPQAWTWQRSDGVEQPMNAAVQTWLGQLDTAARSRWKPAPASPPADVTAPLRLRRDGRLHTTVHVEGTAVRVETPGEAAAAPTAAAAALPPAVAEALRASLEQAAP